MLKRLLIANRGEIARRIIKTCRRMGVETVAVYSDADAKAPHVREADFSVRIGPPPARESYLDMDKVLAAAKETGADSVHPGYGFLSENAAFAEAVEAAGLVWVGPPASAIRAMGLKDAAKALMMQAGVPVTPGYQGDDQAPERLAAEAAKIGFPVLVKAVAGGGGKGVRKVDRAEDFDAALASARREASAAFGDERVLIETYVTRPRHIEVQVFADAHGNVVHLFERDCSLQRRHQKVIEEAPAPGMDEATREAVCSAAVRAAKAVDYRGAGTIEFIADASEGLRADRIFFMEMNTRLQVEHPVTEMITGQDLVEWQLRVASGEPLPKRQDELSIDGWAMEARLYAENPATGFLPSTGRLERFSTGNRIYRDERPWLRIDSAVEEGGEVTPFYDPMIAKLIVHAPDRVAAAGRLSEACERVRAWPVRTNAGFLARAAGNPDFVAGRVDTNFIPERIDRLAQPTAPTQKQLDGVAARFRADSFYDDASSGLDDWDLTGFRLNAPPKGSMTLWLGDTAIESSVLGECPTAASHEVSDREEIALFAKGDAWLVMRERPLAAVAGAASDGQLLAPMPGKVVHLQVKAGDRVAKGAPVVTLEAMKMEHGLTAPFDALVAEAPVTVGQQVAEGTLLVRLEAVEG